MDISSPSASADHMEVLVVDDEETFSGTVIACLQSHGYVAGGCLDGKSALALLAKRPVGLILTDIFMPGIDGFELIMRLRKACPAAQIIAMSGGGYESAEKVLKMATHFGAKRVLEKPFAPVTLLAVVNELIGAPTKK